MRLPLFVLQLLCRASMRPGRFHPGNFRSRRLATPNLHSFNEAGAFPPRKLYHLRFSSCRALVGFNEAGAFPPRKSRPWRRATPPTRRFNEAGAFPPRKSRNQEMGEPTAGASMRPGRFHPGNHGRRRVAHRVGRASMRPGRFHPGNGLRGTGSDTGECWLQ